MIKFTVLGLILGLLLLAACGDGKPDYDYVVEGRFEGHQWGLPNSQLTSVDNDTRHAGWHGARIEGGHIFGLYLGNDGHLIGLDSVTCYRWYIFLNHRTLDQITKVEPCSVERPEPDDRIEVPWDQ